MIFSPSDKNWQFGQNLMNYWAKSYEFWWLKMILSQAPNIIGLIRLVSFAQN